MLHTSFLERDGCVCVASGNLFVSLLRVSSCSNWSDGKGVDHMEIKYGKQENKEDTLTRKITYIFSLLIEKYICVRRNVSVKPPCVYVCLSSGDFFIFSVSFLFLFLFIFVICSSVLFFPRGNRWMHCKWITEYLSVVLISLIIDYLYKFGLSSERVKSILPALIEVDIWLKEIPDRTELT